MELSTESEAVTFIPAPLRFGDVHAADVFSQKNNKTVAETLQHVKYARLATRVVALHGDRLEMKLGAFLAALKRAGDPLYREFLNSYGDLEFCEFGLADRAVGRLKGLYCFMAADRLMYIGRSTDCFWKRINQGYGRIHPKNCYRDGQSTNCHLNALIASALPDVSLFVHPMTDTETIVSTEAALIRTYNPPWNIQLRTKHP